jgi:lipoprotein-releasing system ATP-binding protein
VTATVEVENVSKRFKTRSQELLILEGVGFTLNAGEALAVTGPSGSGKTTLLNILGTLEPPDTGRVTIAGENPFELDDRALARFRNAKIGFIFQEHHLLPQCNVLENVLIPTLAFNTGNQRDTTGRAKELLAAVGLADRIDHRPAELSGGERQRVAIARALINGPALLLADEPTGNLDQKTADTIAELLDSVHKKENAALIVVTHSERLAERFPRRVELRDRALVAV